MDVHEVDPATGVFTSKIKDGTADFESNERTSVSVYLRNEAGIVLRTMTIYITFTAVENNCDITSETPVVTITHDPLDLSSISTDMA